jgi:hypothetical protein
MRCRYRGSKESAVADSGGSSFLGFVLGGVVVVLAIVVFLVYGGNLGSRDTVKVELPKPTATR